MSTRHKRRPGDSWSDEKVAELKRLYDLEISTSNIARQMGLKDKNAVVGKICRLGWKRPEGFHPINEESPWPPERRELVKKLYFDNYSAGSIALVIGASRGSVGNLIDRMGWKRPRLTQIPRPKAERKPATPKAGPAPRPVFMAVVVNDPRNIPLIDLEPQDCRYSTDEDERGHLFCGHRSMPGHAYCLPHVHLTTNTRPPLKRPAARKPDYVEQAQSRRFA